MPKKYTTRKQIINFCMSLGNDIYEDYPFDDNWLAMRHRNGGKVMCFCYEYYIGTLWLNVKCDNDYMEYWLKAYPESVLPGYHQSKKHWLTLVLDGSIANEDIETLLKNSYVLTQKHKRQRNNLC